MFLQTSCNVRRTPDVVKAGQRLTSCIETLLEALHDVYTPLFVRIARHAQSLPCSVEADLRPHLGGCLFVVLVRDEDLSLDCALGQERCLIGQRSVPPQDSFERVELPVHLDGRVQASRTRGCT